MSRRDENIRQNYGLFVKQYARKSKHRNGHDPNDRHYDRKFEELIKKISPEELQHILNEELENDNKDGD